ncbi:hypothetical protein BS47DRAFT_1426050 [Hydnum rufescens UP504]|uniref:Uncharacterized protein n=1 Tax=Hydnum rufescens UP504 TaxID=1448309 RepID=A0A9P6AJK6_9AGAM|nr:hypothetical protein BS47DRAFT_1426050 [Hydnum rufescens UP504]
MALQGVHKAVDSGLANAGAAAEAIHTSLSLLPGVTSDHNNEAPRASLVAKGIDAVRAQVQQGLPDPSTAPKAIIAASMRLAPSFFTSLKDLMTEMMLELLISELARASKYPIASKIVKAAEVQAISTLYHNLPHPPTTHVGREHQFRSADGSGNNSSDPNLGKAFTPYSRSVLTTRPLPPNELPDPGVVFDTLLRRALNDASLCIHRPHTLWLNINPSVRPRPRWSQRFVLQLGSILYGNTQDHLDKIRYKDGRGSLLPDVFAETRLLTLPPGVSALTVCFNRHHNYIADILLSINERGSWTTNFKALTDDQKRLLRQDEEIFQTARLINSAFYANVVTGDYLPAILGTQREASNWILDSTAELRLSDGTLLERGRGNSVSVEFNTLYRWHPTLSQDDAAYIETAFQHFFKNSDYDKITVDLFERTFNTLGLTGGDKDGPGQLRDKDGNRISPPDFNSLTEEENSNLRDDSKPVDYLQLSIQTLQRDPHTKLYSDDGLARILQRATSVPAGAFRVARSWGCCSLNDFRRFLGLKPYATFEEWNPNRDIAEAAHQLYGDIETLELYVGLAAEEDRSVKPGVGLCSPYTTSRAVLADAVSLVRGDRYLTYDLTPFNLTAWGFAYANRNPNNAAWGGQLGRVLARALPNHYDAESVYTHFPSSHPLDIQTPSTKFWRNMTMQLVADPIAIYRALRDGTDKKLVTPYAKNILDIKLSPSFLGKIDDPRAYGTITKSVQELFVPKNELEGIGKYFYDTTLQLLQEKSLRLKDQGLHLVNIVKDVLRLVPVYWVSTQIAGLPVKTAADPLGVYYEQQLYQILKDIYSYFIFVEADTSLKIPQRQAVKEHVERLLNLIDISLTKAKGGVSIPGLLVAPILNLVVGSSSNLDALLKRLLESQSDIKKVANDILAVISTSSTELSQIFVHVINFYLPPDAPSEYASADIHQEHERAIDSFHKVVQAAGSNNIHQLEGYVREALRLDPVIEGVYRQEGNAKYLYDFRAAGLNSGRFENPRAIDLNRSTQLYSTLHGDGVFKTLGEDFVYKVTGQVLRAVFTKANLKRTTGPLGTLRRFLIPIQPIRDTVEATKKEVEVPHPYKTGEKAYTDGYTYTLTPPQGDRAVRYQYQDPEDDYRLTTWATGLSVTYSA